MKTFEYRGYDADGSSRTGLIEASDRKEARERLAGSGVLVGKIKESRGGTKIRPDQRATIYRELSSLLGAGVPLAEALDLLIESQEKNDLKSVLASARDRVKDGEGFASSFSPVTSSVSVFEEAILEGAERSAGVAPALERMASFLEGQAEIHHRVQGALIYPAIVLGSGICVGILMLGLLVPRIESLFDDAGYELPAITGFIMGLGDILFRWGFLFLVVIAAGVWFFRRRLSTDFEFRRDLNRFLFRLPLIGYGYRILVNLRFSRTLAALLSSGVPLLEAFNLSAKSTGSGWILDRASDEIEKIRNGAMLSSAIANIEPLAGSLPGWVRVGESGGDVVRMLDSAGCRFEWLWDRFVGRSLSFLEPVLILIIGLFVLIITVAVLLPIVSLTETLRF